MKTHSLWAADKLGSMNISKRYLILKVKDDNSNRVPTHIINCILDVKSLSIEMHGFSCQTFARAQNKCEMHLKTMFSCLSIENHQQFTDLSIIQQEEQVL